MGNTSLEKKERKMNLFCYCFSLQDMLQYYLNLTDANQKKDANWKLEYNLTNTYGIEDLQPKSLYGLAKQFTIKNSAQFMKYYNYFFVSYDKIGICKGRCKTLQVCSILNLDHASYLDCIKKHIIYNA